jgi:hypothetical protein
MYLNIFKYYYRNKNFCKKKSITLVYKMAAGLLKKKKEETPLKDFVKDLKNNSKVVNATNMALINSTVSTLKTLPHLVDFVLVSGISGYLMYYYMQNYECNM